MFNRKSDKLELILGENSKITGNIESDSFLSVQHTEILRQRIEGEIGGIHDILSAQATLTGFCGEILPFTRGTRCELHNQTMTIIALSKGHQWNECTTR